MSLTIATEPTSLVAVTDQCDRLDIWVGQSESVAELRDADHQLDLVQQHLRFTSTEGCARVEASRRRIEVRIGKLLGPTAAGQRHDLEPSLANEGSDLTPNERHQFRKMAENEDIVDEVIAESDDDDPPSRSKVQRKIRDRKPPKPRRSNLPEAARKAGWELRKAVERIERIVSDDRYPAHREQVTAALAAHLSFAAEVLADLDDIRHQSQED